MASTLCFCGTRFDHGAGRLAESVGGPWLGVLADTFHMRIEERSAAAGTGLAAHWIHAHASECDWGAAGCDVVFEACGRSLPKLAAATCVWRDHAGDPLECARSSRAFRPDLLLQPPRRHMKIGFHTDALNSSYFSFQACADWAAANDIHYIECGLIDGVSWIHGLGYRPRVALYEDPELLRRNGPMIERSLAWLRRTLGELGIRETR